MANCGCKKLIFSGSVMSAGGGDSTYDPITGILTVAGKTLAPVVKVTQADGTVVPIATGGVLTLPSFVKSAVDGSGAPLAVSPAGVLTIPAETAAQTPFTPVPGNNATTVQAALANVQTALAASVPKCGYTPGQGVVVDAAGCIAASGSTAIKAIKDVSGAIVAPNAAGEVQLRTLPATVAGDAGKIFVVNAAGLPVLVQALDSFGLPLTFA